MVLVLLVSQLAPVVPEKHVQLYPPPISLQVPLFWHGDELQMLT